MRDNSIERVEISGHDCTIIDAGGLRFFYVIEEGRMPDEHHYRFYDANGNIVWQIS